MRVASKGQLTMTGDRAFTGMLVELHPFRSVLPSAEMVILIAKISPTKHASERKAFRKELTNRPMCYRKQKNRAVLNTPGKECGILLYFCIGIQNNNVDKQVWLYVLFFPRHALVGITKSSKMSRFGLCFHTYLKKRTYIFTLDKAYLPVSSW